MGNFGTGWDGSICDEEHIAGALEELGHTVYRQQRDETNDLPEDTIDFVLVAQWDGYHSIGFFTKRLKEKYNCPIVYWAFDHQDQDQQWHRQLIEGADLYLSKRIADSIFPNWTWLSQDFAPAFLDKHPIPVEKDIDVLFTGSYLPWATERNETLKAVDEKFNLVIHSVNEWPDFKDVRPPIMDDGLPELYARAKGILSIDHTLEAGYWSDRNAQIICCDARPLFRYIPLSETRFHNDVDYFYSIDDCLNKIQERLDQAIYIFPTSDTRKYKVKYRVQDLLTIVSSIL